MLDLGEMAVADFIDHGDALFAPLTLAVCDPDAGGCTFVQLLHEALDQNVLYRRYWYRSGTNESMRAALSDIVASVESAVDLRPGDVVLDIGSNDGTLLRAYTRNDPTRVGFDPAENLLPEARVGTDLIVPEYFTADAFERELGREVRARAVTSIAMFYDLEDPHEFVRDVARILAPDGLWIVQMAYLPSMLAQNNFDNICHEHVGYYSLSVMDRVVRSHGLQVRDVELNEINGGSFRLYLQHADCDAPWPIPGNVERLETLRREERAGGLTRTETYREFGRRIGQIRDEVCRFVEQELSRGRTMHVYGASTKGNTILQYFGLGRRHFRMAAERSSNKWGLRTVATDIPIVPEEVSRSARPDYYFVLPWHFRASFLVREEDFLRRGGAMVFPLPNPAIVRMVSGELRETRLQQRISATEGGGPG